MSEVNDFQFKVILQCEQEEFNPTRKQYCEYLVEMNGVERSLRDILKENIEQQATISALKEENEQLRLELETHKHPLWSTREAEKKVNKLADSLADEVKKNGLLNEEINQLRIENMRLKKKVVNGV